MVLKFHTSFWNKAIISFLIKNHIIEPSIWFCWVTLKLKYDVLNIHDECFQYSRKAPDILFIWMIIPHKSDVTIEGKNLEK